MEFVRLNKVKVILGAHKGTYTLKGGNNMATHVDLARDNIMGVLDTELYHQFPGTTVTVCLLTVLNGFSVLGQSACVNMSDFDAEMGRKYAKEDAINQLWRLEGYLAKQRLFEKGLADE
jgi:hypothetical protein